MIQKPSAEEFRERTAVTVLRESKKIAVESGRGAAAGLVKIYLYGLGGVMGFGIVMTLLIDGHTAKIAWTLLLGLPGFMIFRKRRSRREPMPLPGAVGPWAAGPAAAARGTSRINQSGELHLEISALAKAVVALLCVTAFLIFLSILQVWFLLGSIVLGALAILIGVRIFSDRVVMRYDHRSISVTGLLGSGEMAWIDVEDIFARTSSRFNLAVLFTSGARRNLVISAPRNRLGGPRELLIPIDFIGLDKQQLIELVTNLICCRAAGGTAVDAWQQEEQPSPPPALALTPACDPRKSFDPDEIIARHVAERTQTIAQNRPDLQVGAVPPQRVFGRKTG